MSAAAVSEDLLYYKGSNFLRQRLVLSILSCKPIRITSIRVLEDEPGLKEYEVSLIRLLDKITNGTLIELNETGTALYFRPGLLHGGALEHQCSTQRGIGYYLETLLMLGMYCKEPISATLHGVTNNNIDPSPDVIKASLLTTIKRFILDDEGFEIRVIRRGMLPLGGGLVSFKCPLRTQFRAINLSTSGMIKKVRGTAYALRMSPAIANRLVQGAKSVLCNFLPDVYITTDQNRGQNSGKSPGFGIHLMAESNAGVIFSSERVSNTDRQDESALPEEIGKAAAQRLLHEIYLGGCCDSTSQTLVLLCIALGQQNVSKFVSGPLTEHSIGFLRHLRDFFGITFKLEEYVDEDLNEGDLGGGSKVLLTCVGVSYKNINKRVI